MCMHAIFLECVPGTKTWITIMLLALEEAYASYGYFEYILISIFAL